MNAIAAALPKAKVLTLSEMFRNADEFFTKRADPTVPRDEGMWAGSPEDNSAFRSAMSCLSEAELLRELSDTEVPTFELSASYNLEAARWAPGD